MGLGRMSVAAVSAGAVVLSLAWVPAGATDVAGASEHLATGAAAEQSAEQVADLSWITLPKVVRGGSLAWSGQAYGSTEQRQQALDAAVKLKWSLDGTDEAVEAPLAGAAIIPSAWIGRTVTATVRATADGWSGEHVLGTGIAVAAALQTRPSVSMLGSWKVGGTLKAVWNSVQPPDAVVGYEWLVAGVVRGSGSSLLLGTADAGKTVSLRMTMDRPWHERGIWTYDYLNVVKPLPEPVDPTPPVYPPSTPSPPTIPSMPPEVPGKVYGTPKLIAPQRARVGKKVVIKVTNYRKGQILQVLPDWYRAKNMGFVRVTQDGTLTVRLKPVKVAKGKKSRTVRITVHYGNKTKTVRVKVRR